MTCINPTTVWSVKLPERTKASPQLPSKPVSDLLDLAYRQSLCIRLRKGRVWSNASSRKVVYLSVVIQDSYYIPYSHTQIPKKSGNDYIKTHRSVKQEAHQRALPMASILKMKCETEHRSQWCFRIIVMTLLVPLGPIASLFLDCVK